MIKQGSGGQTEKILITKERVIDAKKSFGQCQCRGRYCGHRDRCGEPLGEGWKIRLSPPSADFGDPMEMTPKEFAVLLENTVALCTACVSHQPNPLIDPQRP